MRGERGSVSVVAAAVVALVMVLSLGAADLARAISAVARAQTAADAAALAAAQELAIPSGLDPTKAAFDYAVRNGAALVACDCPRGALEATVRVSVDVGPMLLLADDRAVAATARAVVENASA